MWGTPVPFQPNTARWIYVPIMAHLCTHLPIETHVPFNQKWQGVYLAAQNFVITMSIQVCLNIDTLYNLQLIKSIVRRSILHSWSFRSPLSSECRGIHMLLPGWLLLIAGTWASWKVAGGVVMILGIVVGFCQASWVVVWVVIFSLIWSNM